ncbi:MAG: tetraacyldisaccharide 4'-kinase [Vicinamibacteria bacterium]
MTPPAPRPWLGPLGSAFAALAAARVGLHRSGLLRPARLSGPVVSVGNLSLGGSGKTPVVAWIAERLAREGVPVAVLSRGYAGRFAGDALVVSDGSRIDADAAECGDEPLMLARRLPGVVVAVGRQRLLAGRAVEARFGRRLHVLDDGFQHLALHRDLDVVCLDPADLDDRPLPAGRLRERPAALARADVVLIGGELREPARLLALGVAAERVHRMRRRPAALLDAAGAAVTPTDPVLLLSGIARPERFAADARAFGLQVAGHASFADHHAFSPAELAAVEAQARALGATLVVATEKDAARLSGARLGLPVAALRLELTVDGEERLLERLRELARGLA